MIKFFLSSILFCGCLLACNTNKKNSTAGSTEYPPVETQPPNTQYQPAFAGQTRVGGVKTTTALAIKVLTDQLVNPWGITPLPDGRLLITEKAGTLRIATTAGELSSPITGLPAVNADGQGGLLGLTIDPDFTTNRMVYWSFAEKNAEGTVTAVAKGRLSNDEKTVENAKVIYRATPAFNSTLHYGSRLVFDKAGHLFVSTGERSHIQARPQAQWLTSGLGKIIRITKDGQPVADNPFAKQAGARPELFSYGHRNVQGLAIHPQTGDLWSNEFGPRGGDELNLVQAGKNYGWPIITYGIEYDGKKIGDGITQKEGMEQPVYYWDPVVSPSGMTFYSGTAIAEWQNNLFIACLSGSHLLRLVLQNNKVTGEERLLSGLQQRFRDVAQGTDGALYIVCDGQHGRLYKISPK